MTTGPREAEIHAPPTAESSAAASEPVSAAAPVDHIVRDIRDGLAQITTRELELRRREQDFDRQYLELKREARQAAVAELEQVQRRLAQQAAELSAQAVEISARRARLGEAGEQLRAKQVELEQQRTDLALRIQQARQRAERLRAWEARQREVLEQRARELGQQEADFRQRVQRAHQDITRQRRETDQRQAELEARATALEQAEHELAERHAALERRLKQGEVLATEVEQHHGELSVARDWLEHERAELERAAGEVKVERARIAREWDQLEAASHELVAERKRLSERHAQLERACAEFDAERQRLTEERRQLEEARRALEPERAELARQRAELDERKSTLEIERVELGQQRRRIEQVAQELKAAQEALRKKQEDLDRRWQEGRNQQVHTQRQHDEVEAARRTLEQQQAAAEERAQRLARREAQFREKLAALEAEKDRLAQWEAELDTRRESLDASIEQAKQIQAEAQRQNAEALALREQAENRETEARQTALSLEMERQALEAARAATQADLDRQRELAEQAEAVAGSTPATAPASLAERRGPSPYWRRRTAVVAATAALVAALGWLATHPATYRAAIALRITTADTTWSDAAARHRAQLLDPQLLAGGPGDLAASWREACEQNRVAAPAAADEPVLRLTLTCAGPDEADRLLRAATNAYIQRVESGAVGADAPAALPDLISRRTALETALQELRQQQAAEAAEAPAATDEEARRQAAARAERLEAELADITRTLEGQRGELAALVAAEVPRGSVSPGEIDRALEQDAIYREDREEFRAVALQYRTELAVAMLQLVDPAKQTDQALGKLAGVVQEQQRLEPPADIRGGLEACAADVANARAQLGSFLAQWHAWLDVARNLDVREDAASLVNQQTTAADAARQQADAIVALVDELGARIDGLDSVGSGGTRQVVVGAVLRSEHATLAAAGEALQAAAARISPTDNIELNAHDRKLRGLRIRVAQRREAVAQQLQLAADLAARDAHAAAVEQLRAGVRALERRREEAVTGLMGTLRTLRDLDDAARRRGELAVRAQQRAAEIAWLEGRQADVDTELSALRQRQARPDRVEPGEVTVERVSARPVGAAALAGVATFGGVWLIGFLLSGVSPGPGISGRGGRSPG